MKLKMLTALIFITPFLLAPYAWSEPQVLLKKSIFTVTWPNSWATKSDPRLKLRFKNQLDSVITSTLIPAIQKLPSYWRDLTVKSGFHVFIRIHPDIYPSAFTSSVDPNLSQQNSQHTYIFINPNMIFSDTFLSNMAHEFFHAIHGHVNPGEEQWLKEGLASFFESIVFGAPNGSMVHAGLTDGLTPLMGRYSFKPGQLSLPQYGHNLLHIKYLVDQCGGLDLFWSIASGAEQNQKGRQNIEQSLKRLNVKKPTCQSFEKSAISFELARVLNQSTKIQNKWTDDYFLYPTTLKLQLSTVDSPHILTSVNELRLFQPLLIKPNSFQEAYKVCGHKCRYFLVKKDYPASVKEVTISSEVHSGELLLIKTL